MPDHDGFSTLYVHLMLVRPESSAELPSKQKENSGSGYVYVLVAQEGFADEGCP
jgi:hypothetical protein